MSQLHASIRVDVDVANPGQFFACCGLLELADRLWPGAEGWFESPHFCVTCAGSLRMLIERAGEATLNQVDPSDPMSSPIEISDPFRPIRLDWWRGDQSGSKDLKVWAGSMEGVRITRAMQRAIREERYRTGALFNIGTVVYDESGKKVEPFYFDARRAINAHSRDVGFSPNDLQLTTTAFPAVEFFCLIGLQRARPKATNERRVFEYSSWAHPLSAELISVAVAGHLPYRGFRTYRFESWFRTGQRKHKSFRPAIRITQGD